MQAIHEGKKFKCDYCAKTFTFERALRRHVKGFHQGISFACEICGYKTIRKDVLKIHINAKHSN